MNIPRFTMAFSLLVLFLGVSAGQDRTVQEEIGRLGGREWLQAVEELARMGSTAVPDLITAYRRGQPLVSARALTALGRIGTPAALEVVHEATANPDPAMRESAAHALGYHPGESSVAALLAIMTRKDETGRNLSVAAQSLGRLRAAKAVEPLLAVTNSEHWYVRVTAAEALAMIGDPRCIDPLMPLLEDPDGQVRRRVRTALLKFGEPARGAVVRSLREGEADIRWQAAWLLRHLDPGPESAPLVEALQDPDWRVRNEAGLALAAMQDGRPVSLIVELSEGPREEAAEEAAWILTEWEGRRPDPAPDAATAKLTPDLPACPPELPPLYPQLLKSRPGVPSPCITADGRELVVARTTKGQWGAIPVTLENSRRNGRQLYVDATDFPHLAATGLHSEAELERTHSITGRSVAEITDLGRPRGLSTDGFLAASEDIVSVLRGDNERVSRLGLTHPQLARPLIHVWNMILTDLDLGRWDMASHRWKNIEALSYNGGTVVLNAGDTRGGQESIFNDGLGGAFWIEIRRDLTPRENAFLREKYRRLTPAQMATLRAKLSFMKTGEMVPFYVMWYGFYEGHTEWRTDPIAIALIFGLLNLKDIERAFPGKLYEAVTGLYTR